MIKEVTFLKGIYLHGNLPNRPSTPDKVLRRRRSKFRNLTF